MAARQPASMCPGSPTQHTHMHAHPPAAESGLTLPVALFLPAGPCSPALRLPCSAEGNLPVCNGEHTVWQFNFKGFKLSEDVYASDSIELLKQSGIDFAQVCLL